MAPKELDDSWRRLEDFTEAAQALQAVASDQSLFSEALCDLALQVVGGEHASITSVREGRFTTVAATSSVPELADKLQYSTGQGPCLDAIREHGTFCAQDLATDQRWPAFGRAVSTELGMHSLLAHVLPVDDTVLGALNVYSSSRRAFTAQHQTLIGIFGATAAQALRAARNRERAEHLEDALRTSRRIGVALGIVMKTHLVDLDQSWQLLAKASQDRNVKVSVLAEHVIATGSLDGSWGD